MKILTERANQHLYQTETANQVWITANRLLAWGFPFDPSIRMRLMLDYYYRAIHLNTYIYYMDIFRGDSIVSFFEWFYSDSDCLIYFVVCTTLQGSYFI